MDSEDRLEQFRDKVKLARSANDLIDEIDAALLTTAGWTVHADSRSFLGATKVTPAGDELELRVSRRNRTISGLMTPKRRPAKPTTVDAFKLAMFGPAMEEHVEVRKYRTDELGWQEAVRLI